jgi:UDP-glucose 4-epimerase
MVTGGAGYIGSVVVALLLDAGHDVTVLDDLATGHEDAIAPGAQFVKASITDAGPVLAERPYDAVMHLAAKSLVAESVEQPDRYWHNNVGGTLALLLHSGDVR